MFTISFWCNIFILVLPSSYSVLGSTLDPINSIIFQFYSKNFIEINLISLPKFVGIFYYAFLMYFTYSATSMYGNSHRRCSGRKGVLKNFAKFTGKHLCQSLFFNKVTGLRPATLLKKRLWHRRFLANFARFPRTPFSQKPLGDCFSM